MDFELNEDQRMFADTAQQFAAERLAPMAAEWMRNKSSPKAFFERQENSVS